MSQWKCICHLLLTSFPNHHRETSCHIFHFSLFVCVYVQGDVSETVRMFFEESKSFPAATKSLLTIQEVDASLMRLAQLTKEDEQQSELESIAKK